MKSKDYLKNATAYFWKESFAIIKSDQSYPDAFAVIKDKNEITVIIDQNKLQGTILKEYEKNWKILTLDIIFSLDTVGILTKISGCLSEKGIPVMAISAYSRDHFLIRDIDVDNSVGALKSIGITILQIN
ncbi:MAG: hypothetical protein AMS27_17995 [Bacteroides sp. SM23_62_1]|nr:MAG: hypothetical protein AMS27_17995 [Bacteroides sp. SM23_62_1]